ncbi:MAG: hypothetical protein FWB78_12155 [Treponema sp.]|nr:hypothetical protein [Treponema sp.]
MKKLTNFLEWLVRAEDPRQQAKVDHPMKDIIAIVFFAMVPSGFLQEFRERRYFCSCVCRGVSLAAACPQGGSVVD